MIEKVFTVLFLLALVAAYLGDWRNDLKPERAARYSVPYPIMLCYTKTQVRVYDHIGSFLVGEFRREMTTDQQAPGEPSIP